MVKSVKFGICILGFLLLGSAGFSQERPGVNIERIDIRGNRRIPEETIRFYIQSRPGERYDPSQLEFDLRSLYKASFFENIEIQERDGDIGKIITFVLKEKPLIRSIEYAGNKSFTESNILDAYKEKKVGLTVDSQFDPSKLRAAERVLKDLMIQNGKPLGSIHTETEPIPPSGMRVRFVMDEGPKVRIGQIRFVGNKIFTNAELKSALKLSKERGIFTMFKGTDKYHKEKLDVDIDSNLKAFYTERGYMNVQVGEPVTRIFEGSRGMVPMLRKTRQQFFIEIPIEAGTQYRMGKVEVKNCVIFPKCDPLAASFGFKPGDVVNSKRIKDNLEQIKKLYGNSGYINWSYLTERKVDEKNKTIDMTFTFEPDKRFFVRRIDFEGNTKTKDKVIRRELLLEEGHPFNSYYLDNSILRLNQLGFFDKIEEKDYEVKPDDKTGLVDVGIKVKEKSQRSIGFTGGVSGISGSFLGANYSDNNFLGRGETLELSITGGTRTTNFMVSFTEPYLFDTRWSSRVSLFNQRYRYDTYSTYGLTDTSGNATELFTQKTTGTTVEMNRSLGRTLWSFGGQYTYQRIGISNIAPGYETYALGQFVGFTPGMDTSVALSGIIRSEFTPMLRYNSTNSYFNPTRGSSFSLQTSISGGILGGDFNMFRPIVEYRHFFPDKWLSRGRNVFAFNVIGQYIQSYGKSTVPFFDRFFIGGENTIRGFDIRSISPIAISATPQFDSQGNILIDPKTGLAAVNETAIPVGADTVGVFNFEYRIPIAGPLSMSAFYDLGIARVTRESSLGSFTAGSRVEVIGSTNNAIRGSTGVEVQFVLPVVSAPFRLIFAYNPQVLDTRIMVNKQLLRIKEPSRDIKFTVGRSF